MSLAESINRIITKEAEELEACGEFDLIDKHEWAVDRYRELHDEAMADRVDDFFEIEWYWSHVEGDDHTEELKLMYQEYCDAYAANELADQLWEDGIDPWDLDAELCAEDMERDAAIEAHHMCQAAEAEEAYFKRQEEEAKRAKENRRKWGL